MRKQGGCENAYTIYNRGLLETGFHKRFFVIFKMPTKAITISKSIRMVITSAKIFHECEKKLGL